MTSPQPETGTGEPGHPAGGREALLAFRVEGRDFALPLGTVVEVIRYRAPTPVPVPDPAIAGILPLRGRMVTVVDLRRRLGRAAGGGRPGPLIVAESDGEWFGLIVDRVLRVVDGDGEAVVIEPGTIRAESR